VTGAADSLGAAAPPLPAPLVAGFAAAAAFAATAAFAAAACFFFAAAFSAAAAAA
jgi:hypothetical protein